LDPSFKNSRSEHRRPPYPIGIGPPIAIVSVTRHNRPRNQEARENRPQNGSLSRSPVLTRPVSPFRLPAWHWSQKGASTCNLAFFNFGGATSSFSDRPARNHHRRRSSVSAPPSNLRLGDRTYLEVQPHQPLGPLSPIPGACLPPTSSRPRVTFGYPQAGGPMVVTQISGLTRGVPSSLPFSRRHSHYPNNVSIA
jgi:hypothetical protein